VSAVLSLPPALRHRDFRRIWASMLTSGFGTQMISVAVGWQVYSIHHSAFDLGLIGLAEFVPAALVALPAGQLADRVSRTLLATGAVLAEAVVAALLLVVTLNGADSLWQFVALAALTGATAGVGAPAGRSLTPEIVPSELLAGAIALRSVAGQTASIAAPALGGLLFAIRPEAVYIAGILLFLTSAFFMAQVRTPPASVGSAPGLQSLLGGISFIRRTPVMLGAITLDLFAVLFGGAVALLPLFAKSILHTGPFGLGVLRSAVAVGALVAGIRLAHRAIGRYAGRTLLIVVAAFGASMIVFGLSRWFWLSALALAVSGFADMYSMNIRSTIAALATPNELRGRVNAVEGVFIGASNELGAFESGAAAALLGAVPAVVAGGVLTIGLALVWPRLFPALARIDRLEELLPAGAGEVLVVGRAAPAASPEPAD
jgi:MFS family permease